MTIHQRTPELLTPAASDWVTGVRLIAIDEEKQSSITNRPARSTYPSKKSVSTSGAIPINEIWITQSFSLSEGGSHLPDWRREMRKVVRERNTLVHQMLASWNPHSIDSCRALCELIDAQRERMLPAYEHLESIVKAIRESHEEVARDADGIVADILSRRVHGT